MEFTAFLLRISRLTWWMLALPLASTLAHAAKLDWTPPTAAELSMTADTKAPEAPAVILSYDEVDDNRSGDILIHVRLKVLKEAGRSVGDFSRLDGEFKARTIHPDGTIVPLVIPTPKRFLGIFPGKTEQALATALTDVTVGSIIEYIYRDSGDYYSPTWTVQHKFFTHAAHYTFKTPAPKETRWIAHLPPGTSVQLVKDHVDLDLADVPPAPDEDFMPPSTSAIYNVRFFYFSKPAETYWGLEAAEHKDFWDKYTAPDKTLKEVVPTLVQSTDSNTVKLRKLYAAVQALENTDLSRTRTAKEEQRTGIAAPENAGQVWTRQRGTSYQLTLLFIGLARTAGLDASPSAVASRSHAIFDLQYLDWHQLDDLVAIVRLDGKEYFLDPGVRTCPFGHLAPWHDKVIGLTIYEKKVFSKITPYDTSLGSHIDRAADLTLDPTGAVTGTVTLTFNGTAGLPLRLAALLEDEQFIRTNIEKDIQESVPSGVEVKIQSISGLTNGETPLVAKLNVTGRLGITTARRLILPAQFFTSTSKQLFVTTNRTTPVAFPERYSTRDQMTLTLAHGLALESLPKSKITSIPLASAFGTHLQPPAEGKGTIDVQRTFSLDRLDYTVEEYEALHNYFSQIASVDQEQIVLSTVTASTATKSGN